MVHAGSSASHRFFIRRLSERGPTRNRWQRSQRDASQPPRPPDTLTRLARWTSSRCSQRRHGRRFAPDGKASLLRQLSDVMTNKPCRTSGSIDFDGKVDAP